jgi:hypothetical protein
MACTACLVCFISTVNGHSKKRENALEDVSLVAGTQQNLRYLWHIVWVATAKVAALVLVIVEPENVKVVIISFSRLLNFFWAEIKNSCLNGSMTFSRMTFSRMTFSRMTFSRMTF